MTTQWAPATGIGHVRLTVTNISTSKRFYTDLLGVDPAMDFSDQVDEPGVREDPEKLYGGCAFPVGDQLLGLRPVASKGDQFQSTRVGLDHLSLTVGALDDLHATAARLDAVGVKHGEVKELPDAGMAILSLQDPDDINLELTVALD